MAGDFNAKVQGLDELQAVLRSLPDKLRRRALRNALAAGARLVRNAAKTAAPRIRPQAPAVQRGERRPGTLADALRVRTSKDARRAGNVGVFVNVRPAKGAQRGAKKPTDPFYWRFVEFGTKRMRPQPYLQPAGAKLPDALRAFERTLGPQVRKLNLNPKDPL